MQETDEQRRIAERRERAADIGNQKDEKDDHMDVAEPRGIGAQERADQDHGRAGSADHAGDQGAEGEHCRVDERRAAQLSRQQNAAGNHVERKQEHDEAQILTQQRVRESRRRRRRAVYRGKREKRKRAPGEGELAVMAMPESLEQQRAGRDGDKNADERQRPGPPQRRAIERGRGLRRIGNGEEHRGQSAAVQPLPHRDRASKSALMLGTPQRERACSYCCGLSWAAMRLDACGRATTTP